MFDKNLREKILKKVNFSKEALSSKKKSVNLLIEKLNTLKKNNDLEIYIGGSYSKNTFLKDDFDVDLFFCFSKNLDDKTMSKVTHNILKKLNIKINLEKGSRDYFSFNYKNIKYDVVPTKKILLDSINNFENTSDISVFHTNYILEKSKKIKNFFDEVKITKLFFKANNLYGAESYIYGFSGYTIELLIIHFKSFENLLKNAKNFEKNEIVDIENKYKTKEEAFKILGNKISNLTIIDPILKNRNSSKALSFENYSKLIFLAQNIKKLEEKHFKIKKINYQKLIDSKKKFSQKNKFKCLTINTDFDFYNSSKDIVGTKFLKLFKKLRAYFLNFEFSIFESDFQIDFKKQKCLYIFIFDKYEITPLKKIKGPSIFLKEECQNFIKKRKNIFFENDSLYSFKKIKKTKLENYLKFNKKEFEKLSSNKMNFIKKIQINLN